MDRRERGLAFAKVARLGRTVGLGLTVLSFGAVLYEQGAVPAAWLALLLWAFGWPQVAYRLSSRTANPGQAERRNLIADGFLGGLWMPVLGFDAVPCLVFHSLNALSILGSAGPRRLAVGQAAAAAGAILAVLAFGLQFRPASSLTTVLCTAPLLVGYTWVVGWTAFDLARRLNARSRELLEEVARRSAAQAAAQQALLEAEAAGRAKTEFLSQMSHELRTPLNAVIGFAEAMSVGVGGTLSERHRSYVADIASAGQHLLAVIGDILDLAKLESGKAKIEEAEIDLYDMVGGAILFVREQAYGEQIELTAALPDCLPRLRGDLRKVRQVLVNLLSNAVKFTPAGGRISVSAELCPERGLTIAIADTGVGMRQVDIPKALSPYEQVGDRRHGGTGLGLPLVKGMMELHGGELRLESAPGNGTTAAVRFPASRMVA